MACAACGRANPAAARFCGGCGARLIPRCPACGAEGQAAAQFCIACGSSLVVAHPTAPAGARKVVTIVFADLAGSTSLHERLDAESTRAFMDRYYRAMQGAVEAHGGTVTQLLGDGVKAVFGAPRVAEDDAVRAVRAAVDMQRVFRDLASEQGGAVGPVGLRIAVNTGEVVAQDETEIIGDPVNVAARLQQEAQDGDVLVGESTQRLVGQLVTLAPFGTFTLKGRAEPVSAYRVVSLERPAGAPAVAFVGREDELRRLVAIYDAVVATPGTRLAVVLGSPGLGKSRLLAELGRRLGERATLVTARCEATGGATFAPIAEALRALLGIEVGAGHDGVRAAIESALPGDAGERARIADGIAALLSGAPESPEETFFVVRRLLAALAAAKPVVLAIDDLHWAEPLLLDLAEHLVQWGAGIPLLVLAAARPELREARSSLATQGPAVADVVTLSGLDASAATRLAANVIGADALPAALAGRVLATSEGNPLFVGELVRMLVHDGVLRREGDRWTAAAELSALEMPPTIQALLAARIERLRPEERTVLERAAVVGRQFSRTAVAQLLPPELRVELDTRIEALRRSELVEPDTGWLLGEPVLRFHHALIRDAAYRRLLKGTRAELHARFADWLEGRVGEGVEHDETLGWHLEQAHQHLRELGPVDARGRALGERASRRLAAAGRRALGRDDVPLAAGLLGRALDGLDPGDPARADLALDWCETLLAAGEVGAASAAIDELGRFASGSERLRAWHTCFAGELAALTDPKSLRATVDAVAAAAEALAGVGDAAGEAKAHSVHASALMRLGQIGACEAALDRALAAARRVGDRRRANAVLSGAPLAALWGPGPVARASGRCLDVVRVLRITQGAPGVEAVALRCQAVLEALRGRSDAARRMIASSRRMVEELGITQGLLETEMFVGFVELIEGDAAAAEQSLRAAYEGLRDHGLGIDAARAAGLLGLTLLTQDRAAEAEALSHESEALAGDDLQAAITWRRVRAEALARRGEHAAAVELARAAVGVAAATDALLHHGDARLALAATLRAGGRHDEAAAEEARAIELWEAKGATLLAERARQGTSRAERVEPTPAQREEPLRPVRRVRANAATALAVRVEAAFAARNPDAFAWLLADDLEHVHHATGAAYDREGSLRIWRSLLKADDLTYRYEPLATLGESLALCRASISASGVSAGAFDVGAYEGAELHLIETDAEGRGRRAEMFPEHHLGDAIARLYERQAALLPDGPERDRAAAIARSVAALLGPPDRWPFAPEAEATDHRTVGFGSLHGGAAVVEAIRALLQLSDDFTTSVDDILGLRSDALLVRWTTTGTIRASGGAFERAVLMLWVLGADGLLMRWEQFDAGQDAEALARFDELAAGPPAPRPARRVRPNASTANAARLEAAVAARDADALARLLAEQYETIDHTTGAAYGRSSQLDYYRRQHRVQDLARRTEPLATLGDSLAVCRALVSGSAAVGRTFDVGAFEAENHLLIEVDAQGRRLRAEIFAADRLGDAIARLYERHGELLPVGPERTRAAATARSVSALHGSRDRWRGRSAPFAPDGEAWDHRTVGFGSLSGADAVLRAARTLMQLSDGFDDRFDDILDLRSDALLVRATTSGTVRASGGAFEQHLCQLFVFGADGLVTRWEQFDAEQEAEALVRFDELAAAPRAPRPVRRPVRPNAATTHVARVDAAIAARDGDELSNLLTDSSEVMDHTIRVAFDSGALLASWRSLLGALEPAHRTEPLATLGDSLALCRQWVGASSLASRKFDIGAYETEKIIVLEIDTSGRLQRADAFAADRLGDAIARLYERYGELLRDGPARDRAATTARSVAAMLGPYDLDRYASAHAPAIEYMDHRLGGIGSLTGPRAIREWFGSLLEVAEGVANRQDDVLALGPDALLLRWTNFGTERAGAGAYERHFLWLGTFGADGLATHLELFEGDREAEALARFDELAVETQVARSAGESSRAPQKSQRRVRPNAVTANAARFDAAFAARDAELFRALLSDACQVVDHTTGLTYDRQGLLASYHALVGAREPAYRNEPLATLGDSLALCRQSLSASSLATREFEFGAYETEKLTLFEGDASGRLRRAEVFAADHLGDAVARLYERYAELLPDGLARTRAAATARSVSGRGTGPYDLHRWARTLAPAVAAVDHRTLGTWSGQGKEALLDHMRAMVSLAEGIVFRDDDVLGLRADALLVSRTHRGTDRAGGGAYERSFLMLQALDADGLVTRLEYFDADRVEEALARFDELGAGGRDSPFENAASRSLRQFEQRWHERDWEGVVAMLGTGYRVSDRRSLIGMELEGEEGLRSLRMSFDVESGRWSSELLATRGERLALFRRLFRGEVGAAGPFESERLSLIETGADGRRVLQVLFDPEALDAAYDELDARYAAGEASPHVLPWAELQRFGRAVAARDWEQVAAAFTPSFVVEDHRPLGTLSALSRDEWVASVRALVALRPDTALRLNHVLALEDRRVLAVGGWVGSEGEGSFEIPVVVVAERGPEGIQRWHGYGLDQLDAARARFAAIGASHEVEEASREGVASTGEEQRGPEVARDPLAALARPNAASATMDRVAAAIERRDWGALRELAAEGATFEDRRRLARIAGDRDWWVANLKLEIHESGLGEFRRRLVATAGDRICLHRGLWTGSGPAGGRAEIEYLSLHEVDEAGRLISEVVFDPEDWRAASREALGRWLARDAVAAGVLGPAFEAIEGWNDRDRARMRAVLADDVVADDRRLVGQGRVDGVDAVLDMFAVTWDLTPDVLFEPRFVLALECHGCVAVSLYSGTLPDGGPFEIPGIMVATVARGRLSRAELFEIEAAEAALARLAELRPDPLRIPPNAATQAAGRWSDAVAAGDWALLETLFAPTLVFEDRRRRSLVSGGRELLLANDRLIAASRPRSTRTVLATSGENLVLQRVLFSGIHEDVAFEMEYLRIVEIDGDARLVAVIAFDPDDRRAASRELFERHARSERGMPAAALELWRAFLDRDLERYRAAIPADFVFHDRRRSGVGRIEGADAWVAWVATLFEQSPDAIPEPLYTIASSEQGSLTMVHTFGTLAGGGEFETVFLSLWLYRAGQLVGLERFEPDDLELALTRFEELRATSA